MLNINCLQVLTVINVRFNLYMKCNAMVKNKEIEVCCFYEQMLHIQKEPA